MFKEIGENIGELNGKVSMVVLMQRDIKESIQKKANKEDIVNAIDNHKSEYHDTEKNVGKVVIGAAKSDKIQKFAIATIIIILTIIGFNIYYTGG